MGFKVVTFTAPTEIEAVRIARVLLANRLAGNITIIPVKKMVGTEDLIDEMSEYLVVLHTIDSKLKRILKAVHDMHSTEAPDVLLLEVVGGAKRYLQKLAISLSEEEEEEEEEEES